jgi:hypothetical protein
VGRLTRVAFAINPGRFAIWVMLVAPLPSISRTATNCARVNAGLRPRYGESLRPLACSTEHVTGPQLVE